MVYGGVDADAHQIVGKGYTDSQGEETRKPRRTMDV